MILGRSTWKDVQAFDKNAVVLIPTGSLEQHGAHMPVLTDTIIAEAIASAVEAQLPDGTLLTPGVWLGASSHHIAFAGTVTASFGSYHESLVAITTSLFKHGFRKFMLVNGHGGNTEPNGVVVRAVRDLLPSCQIGHIDYFRHILDVLATTMDGPMRNMGHACEAETSLMLHLHPELVRMHLARNDGLEPNPPVKGLALTFEELTEEGSLGYSALGTALKGKAIFEAAVEVVLQNTRNFFHGFVLEPME